MWSRNLFSPHWSDLDCMTNKWKAALLREGKEWTAKKEGTLLKCHSWSRSKNEKKNEKLMTCQTCQFALKKPIYHFRCLQHKENCYSLCKSGNLGKTSKTNIVIGKVKIEESSSGNLKIKIFQGPPPRENWGELKVKLPEAKLPQN